MSDERRGNCGGRVAEEGVVSDRELGCVGGDICNREGCQGTIEDREVESCTCHITPPCSACVDCGAFCTACSWDSEEEDE